MFNPNVLSASAARVQFMKMVRETANGRRFYIRHASGNNAVLLSEEEFRSMQASHRLNRDPRRLRAIRRAKRQIAAGKGIPYDQFRKELGWAAGR
ncbi:MAG: hypothetical protein A3G34_11215 [Candidatus Lindowbacteria bacterium RIFCSPLOWO2_12_FULL_62_27]|nr:MAG: hypothetical protein A3G34_11215 [Candidatus Lindowbacteria bacterium RIFCSPLOWO2_12_FULL_62_27]OGH63464.1 MAG: hypothetical protein A3I06_06780 [Candidatus Lindowbacteria bacterium RIFCSPLOWO2_02_FULL_62_12]